MKYKSVFLVLCILFLNSCSKNYYNIDEGKTSLNNTVSDTDVCSSAKDFSENIVENEAPILNEFDSQTSSVSESSLTISNFEDDSDVYEEKFNTDTSTIVGSTSLEAESTHSSNVTINATAADSKAIEDKLIGYINEYRISQGVPDAVKLIGLTEFAEYRSQQLVTNFTHDIYDERAAATTIKYGKYIDPALWGIDEEPYYTACAGEAIAFGGYIGTVDYIAQSLARQVRDSSSHWAYVGSAEYPYIAVGITLDSGTWYCDIAMSKTNEYEK